LFESTNEVRFFLPGLISFNQPVDSLQDGLASEILEDAAPVVKEMMYPGQSSRLSLAGRWRGALAT